jgi:hypothetical protein
MSAGSINSELLDSDDTYPEDWEMRPRKGARLQQIDSKFAFLGWTGAADNCI